jgi:hypothetical protein
MPVSVTLNTLLLKGFKPSIRRERSTTSVPPQPRSTHAPATASGD